MEPRAQATCWTEVKHKVKTLNPGFYEHLEAVSPSDDLRLLIVKYPYGFQMSDDQGFYLPKGYEDYIGGAGLGKSAPLTFVLDKEIEYYYDTNHNHVPWKICSPGDFFPDTVNSDQEDDLRYKPNSIFSAVSGVKDITLLSLHSNTNDYYNLRRKYDISANFSPTNPQQHFDIFKRVIEKEKIQWHSTVLIFAKEWKHEMANNKKFWPFQRFMFEHSIKSTQRYRSAIFLDQTIHDITRSMNFKFKPYAHEVIKQLLLIASGAFPGFRPTSNNNSFPVKELSEALKNSSRELLSYPIFMQAAMMKKENCHQYIYNSITYNTMTMHTQKLNPNAYLNEIMAHLNDYLLHFSDHLLTRDTVYAQLHNALEVVPCSTRGSTAHGIKKCSEMYDMDKDFWYPRDTLKYNARYGAPINAQFCKGFVGVRWKNGFEQ
jgi:hypothetical protein